MKKTRSLLTLLFLCLYSMLTAQSMSEQMATSFILRYPDPDAIHNFKGVNTIDWQPGYLMFAMEHLWHQTGDRRYFDYIRRYADQHIDEAGDIRQFVPDALDHFIPGYVFLMLYEETGEERYALAADRMREALLSYPRTGHDMFVHGVRMPQVWVDGVFMGQMFLVRYAKVRQHPEDYAEVVRQITTLFKLCGKENGLLLHAWADKGKSRWGTEGPSPEVWSEGLGWIAVLMADVLDWMPQEEAGYDELQRLAIHLCEGLKDCQDPRTGLWCQVVDKPTEEGNWNETSGSAMFTYLLQKAVCKGYVHASEYQPVIDRAYDGLLTKCIRNTDGHYNLIDCSSIGVKSSYQDYISQPHEISTFASIGSFILGTGIVEQHRRETPIQVRPAGVSPLQSFYCTDYSAGRVLRIEQGRMVWQHDAPLSNDLWLLPDDHLLFTTGNGVLELTLQGDTVFSYTTDSKVFACQRLKNGNTFVGECSTGRLLEVSPEGKIVKEVNIATLDETPDDGYIRNARVLADGHYLVAHYSGRRVIEYDRRGRNVWEVSVPGGAHSVARMPNGHTLVAMTDKTHDPMLLEFDRQGAVVWQLSNAELEGEPLKFMSGFQYLPEDDTFLLTNWQGHNKGTKGPDILWVSRDKQILGQFSDPSLLRSASSIIVKTSNPAVH